MSLRVRAPLAEGDIRRGRGEVMEDPYMSRLVKLVPAEAVGPFPFLMQSATQLTADSGGPRWGVYFVAWVLLLIVIAVRWRATHEQGKGAQWGAVLIAAVAFFIWVHVMNGDFGFELLFKSIANGVGPDGITRGVDPAAAASKATQYKDFFSSVSLMAWTTLAPVVYTGEDKQA